MRYLWVTWNRQAARITTVLQLKCKEQIYSHYLTNQGIPESSTQAKAHEQRHTSGDAGTAKQGPCWEITVLYYFHPFLPRVCLGAVFSTALWSLLSFFDPVWPCLILRSSSASGRVPPNPPNTYVICEQMCYLTNTKSTNRSRHNLYVFLHCSSTDFMHS